MSLHFHDLKVAAVEPETDEAVVVRFELPTELRDTFRYTQGQYLTLRAQVNGEDLRRSYSICAGVEEQMLRVGVRKVAGGRFSNWVNTELKVGDTVQVFPPQGRFFVPVAPEEARHYVGIAGGSGITPILSIMKTVLAAEPKSRFTLLYGNRRVLSTMFKDEISDLKDRYTGRLAIHAVFSDEAVESDLFAGVMNRAKVADFLKTLVPPASISHAFICGPYQMNDEAEAALLDAGVEKERIHVERFGTPEMQEGKPAPHEAKAGDAEVAKVTVIRDGFTRLIEVLGSDPSLLDAAARAGMDVPYSCKSGVCSTCRCKVLEGQVRMDRNFALEKHEVEAGFVLACQAHALTPTVTLSFDER
ncbi:1,2-phenylacetyl-CoA epoxidase subunit PaaE [Inhella gelatinilytica]|uniref:Phenylacetate-CoA oxygenase/reductase subunit PaaK n=1 Tax=Inhella gelatinilytica TaxID=2795030 RepID=A0A931IXS3_9BURK|nr:1,2-phenylacetyl-CoA epoxidase subunit PaaE [Inhella gelatinilytica]MBH9551963.1 phenylacetate-CoA oxygenase/reductase subunit PaaK [Inhella gelatinilytica]